MSGKNKSGKKKSGDKKDKSKKQTHQAAVIDVGSTSVRMQICEFVPGGKRRLLENLVHPIALGADTFSTGVITPETLRALAHVLDNFSSVMNEYGVSDYRAVATSAVRDATNRDFIIDRLRHETGMRVQILDAVEESRMMFRCIRPFLQEHLPGGSNHSLVVDLGGGSSEIIVMRGHKVMQGASRRMGTSRLFQNQSDSDCQDAYAMLSNLIRNSVRSTRDIFGDIRFRECVFANPQLLKSVKSSKNSRPIKGGYTMGTVNFNRLVKKALSMNEEHVVESFGLMPTGAQLLIPALIVVQNFLELTRARRVLVPEVDPLSGLVDDIEITMQGGDPAESFRQDMIDSLTGLMEKYHANPWHAKKVRDLSLQIFDGLKSYLDLTSADRVLLEIAALLHDIGRFVSDRDHHKHGMYLVNWSEIMGLNQEDRNLVGLLVRYHRKGRPRISHLEYGSLPTGERLRVSKLSSLLRLADALDSGHAQQVRGVHVEIEEGRLRICAESESDLLVEAPVIADKAKLFTDITGLKVELCRRT